MLRSIPHHRALTALVSTTLLAGAAFAESTLVDFDSGAQGWSINGWNVISDPGGNPGPHINLNITDTFGISVRNDTNAAFLGDYTAKGPVRLGIDFDVRWVDFFGTPVTRDIVLELRDYDNPPGNYPYVSVWYNFGPLPAPSAGWERFEIEIVDPNATELPPGWGGYGAEAPETFEPELPADRTFTDVIDGVDEIVWTTFVPGFFYGFTNFNVSVDNIRIECMGDDCPGDIDGDGNVGFTDLNLVLNAWGVCPVPPPACEADLDGDLNVGFTDLNLVLNAWGTCN